MRIHALILLSALLQAGASAQGPTGTIQGIVARAGTGEPVVGADISLNRSSAATTPARAGRVSTSVSDESGRFVFTDVPAGTFTVSVQHPKYFGKSTNGANASVVVTAGQQSQVSIAMIPAAVIRGRIRDVSGQFLSNAAVDAYAIAYRNGLPYLQSIVSKTSDDRGEYRLFGVPPGDYYIAVTPRPPTAIAAQAGGDRSVRTFYPAAVDVSDARKITIQGGEDISSIDIGIQNTPVFKISGRVSTTVPAAPTSPAAQGAFAIIQQNQNNMIQLILISRDLNAPRTLNDQIRETAVSVAATASGPFEISGVFPGSYDLLAAFGDDHGVPFVARTQVDIRNQDVVGLSLTVRPGTPIRGTVVVDGAAPRLPLRLSVLPVDTLRRLDVSLPVTLAQDGTFTTPSAPEGRFNIVAPGLPPDLYTEDVRQASVSVYDKGFEVHGNSLDPIQVIIKSGAGTLEGTIQDAAGKAVASASIALVPLTRRENQALYYSATADSAGKFTLRGIAPEDYKIFAWESIPAGAYLNAAFLEKYEDRGMTMKIAPAARATATVTVLPR